MNPTLDETRAFIRWLFEGVTDKAGRPFAEHCERVEARLPPEATEDERHAALLHDVIEDTPIRGCDLQQMGYSDRTVDLVWGLSRRPGALYLPWIESIAASGDASLIRIKLADNMDNGDPARIAAIPEAERGFTSRYAKARPILESALSLMTGGVDGR